jgi:ribosomal protein L29
VAQSQNPRNIRQVKKKLANLRKVIGEVLTGQEKICEIKAQDSALIAAAV